MQKKCIFHYPAPFEKKKRSGSELRPICMLEALKSCGYEVEIISGYGKERKRKIKDIKRKIKCGEKYDFIYSESLTQPTLLSEENHIPKHPFMDFSFFGFCKKRGIIITLFYRDIYWKFDKYKELLSIWKRGILVPFFKYDLFQYKKYLDILYCPNINFAKLGLDDFFIKELPPGCKINTDVTNYKKVKEKKDNYIKVFYVGGIAGFYDISTFLLAMQSVKCVELTICTSENHWLENKHLIEELINERVVVVHEDSDNLEQYYREADMSLLCKKNDTYANISSPIKAKETLGYGTPIIVSDNLAVAEDVKKGDYGWIVEPEPSAIKELLEYLSNHPEEINQKTQNAIRAAKYNTWKARAEQIIEDCKKIEANKNPKL